MDVGIDARAGTKTAGREGHLLGDVDLVVRVHLEHGIVARRPLDPDVGVADIDIGIERQDRVAERARDADQRFRRTF